MNLTKSFSFFDPNIVTDRIHIVGCGSVGSAVAELLVRSGLTKLTLWDFDKVEDKNIVNQLYTVSHIGKAKVDALKDILCEINPEVSEDITLRRNGWNGEMLSGYVFLAVDNIDLRREIVQKHLRSKNVKGVFDFRTLLTSAQHYAADWSSDLQRNNLLKTMQYTHEEAMADTPVSACGETLGVASTVRLIVVYGVNNFLNFVKGEKLKTFIEADGFAFTLDAV